MGIPVAGGGCSRIRWFVVLLAMVVSGGVLAQAGGLPPGGTLHIQFTSAGAPADRIHFVPAQGAPETVFIRDLRDLGGGPKDSCALALSDNGSSANVPPNESRLLSLGGGDGKTVGFNKSKDQVGIREQKRGTDCGRVVSGQSVVLTLGSRLAAAQLKAVRSQLGFTVKKNVVVRIEAVAGGGAPLLFFLRSGNSVIRGEGHPPAGISLQDWNGGVPPAPANVYNCNPSSDSGPDADAICQINGLEAIWDQLTLRSSGSVDGEFAIGPVASSFELAAISGVLDCGDTSITAEDETSGATAFLRRLENVGPVQQCTPIPYVLRWKDQQVQFLANYLGQDTAYVWHTDWAPENIADLRPADDHNTPEVDERAVLVGEGNAAGTATARIPPSQQRFLEDDPLYYVDLCLGELERDGTGKVIGLLPPTEGFPDLSELDGSQYGCWFVRELRYDPLDENGVPLGADWVQLRETGILFGDWTANRLAR